jgi:predicted metal-dependent peptidase
MSEQTNTLSALPTKATLTHEQAKRMEIVRVAFMTSCPFYANYFYAEMIEYPTLDPSIPSAATDGRRLFYNPEYVCGLKTAEAVFVFAHELDHVVCRHPQRIKHYQVEKNIKGKPIDMGQVNHAADYVINAGLIENGIGQCNPDWLFDPAVASSEIWEDVYARRFKSPPPPSQGGSGKGQGAGQGDKGGQQDNQQAQPNQQGQANAQGQAGGNGTGQAVKQDNPTYGGSGKAPRGAKGDPQAQAQGGSFDQVLAPRVDPVTGSEDIPDEGEFKEAIARAYTVAKAMGNVPGTIKRLVDEIMAPKVDWKEHVRMLITGKIGNNRESWAKPNRRRLALNPIVIMPGRTGHGADMVVVAVDTSGSIGKAELDEFMAEVGGILNDCRPKRIVVIGCDAAISKVEEVRTLDEVADLGRKGLGGGGGTDFRPVFSYIEKENLQPETVIYLTDLYGRFPSQAPAYPVIWAATSSREVPWGDVVRLEA